MYRTSRLFIICIFAWALATPAGLAEPAKTPVTVRIVLSGETPTTETLRGVRSAGLALTRSDRAVPPGMRDPWSSLYFSGVRLDESIEQLERVARLRPDDERVHASLGMAYLRKGRGEDARKTLLHLRRLHPDNWIAPLGLALLHAGQDEPQEACELLGEALHLGREAARDAAGKETPLRGLDCAAGWLR